MLPAAPLSCCEEWPEKVINRPSSAPMMVLDDERETDDDDDNRESPLDIFSAKELAMERSVMALDNVD